MILIKPDTGEIYKEFLSRYTTTTGLSNVKQLAEKTLSYRKNLDNPFSAFRLEDNFICLQIKQ
jgi:hypothetical protein